LVKIFHVSLLVPALAQNYKQHILSPAKVRKICYSLAELYVKAVYLIYLGGGGLKFMKHLKERLKLLKFGNLCTKLIKPS
jgi:hypothetical protein